MLDSKIINGLKIQYRKGSSDENVIHETFNEKIFEQGFPEYKAKNDHLIIDIGAHIGAYSLKLSNIVNKGKIYAFEPCNETFELLDLNIKENHIKNIYPVKIALSDFIGETNLFYDIENGNWGHSIIKEFSNACEVVKTDTLSSFFLQNEILKCDYIKFNCEGAEFPILLSTPINILRRVRNMLVLYHLDLIEEDKLNELLNHLSKAGFYLEIRNRSEERGWIIARRISLLRKIAKSLRKQASHIVRFINKR